ncbi:TraI/MobA(P) family conjugative relaxase [Acidisoma cladoniae]|uniref:TraI/MobA(P) family conjugative relaxase n=1 Tax=Acidisoma cladoniae TaxID=3040935 RepID=UPI00254FA875|nr:TraI/MobA(P) family conjugative relaxase [Acidisoma sp. PAMC 29798]
MSRRVAGGSFGRLAAYVSDLKKIGDLRDWRKTADYILDKKGGGERVEAIRVTNCHYEEPGMALAEIARTQECNTTSKTDKTYHLIVSFPPGETPTPAQLHDIEDKLCEAIGLADHQRISAVHNDRDHFHFHVAINKVHPQSFRTVTPYFDQPRLQAACIELEKKHGLTPTNHQMPDRSQWAVKGRAEAMELHGKQQSLIQWVRDEAGPVLLAVQETGQGWQDLHRAAATYGLEIKPRGAGLIIAVAGEKYARVKPSEIDRRLSFGALTEKWGDYQAPKGPQPAPEKAYPRAPLHTPSPSTASLFRDFQRDRERALAERKTSRETTRATASAWRAEMADWAAERRAAIKAMPFTAEGRREAYAALKREKQLVMEREKARRAEERKPAANRGLPTWQGWLQEQAARGNTLAAEVLRSTDQRQAELGAAVLSAENADQARHVVYQHLRPVVGKDGSITYRVADGGRVTDQARQVRVDEVSVAATFLALSLAADRFGDRALVVGGTDAFKTQLANLAAIEGMNVTFADPAMEAERQRQVREHQARQAGRPAAPPATGKTQADPELAAFIERRNDARSKVSEILPHRAWGPSDAGEVVYRGRRQLGEGREVLLFDRDGETLVKNATPAQAARASTIRIGDAVDVDARGRLHEHQVQPEKDQCPQR